MSFEFFLASGTLLSHNLSGFFKHCEVGTVSKYL